MIRLAPSFLATMAPTAQPKLIAPCDPSPSNILNKIGAKNESPEPTVSKTLIL
jgi:hypothetical protein